MAKSSTGQGFLLEEWKEARSSIRRFDEYLLNLRRYGFTLATILIGADAYLSIQEAVLPWAKAGAAAAVMLLIFALFLLDQFVNQLQEVALCRAVQLEKQLEQDSKSKSLSELRQNVANSWQATYGGVLVYVSFLLVTGGIGITAVLTTTPGEQVSWGPLILIVSVFLILQFWISVYWPMTRRVAYLLTPDRVKKPVAGVFTQLEQRLQEKDKQTKK